MNIYFSENIKDLRTKRNLTQEKLAEYLGVSFQAISKWERGECYPDITLLPIISNFFGVTLDELFGINRAETETKLINMIKKYDNLCDVNMRKELLSKLIQTSPNDFRVLLRELGYLVHFCNDSDSAKRIKVIYNNIKQNCSSGKIRISATRHIIYYYADLANCNNSSVSFADVESLLKDMPYMRDGQEFISSYLYPAGHPNYYKNIQESIEESICLLDTSVSHYFLYDENFSVEYKIDMLQKSILIKNIIYDDRNYGRQWKSIIYSYGNLGCLYFEKGDLEKSLENLKKSAELAKEFDSLDRITIMHSSLFDGRKFDKHKLGSTYSACSDLKNFLEQYLLSDDFKNSKEFREIVNNLN